MAIRTKNLDLNTDGMKQFAQVSLGDITATRRYIIFTAPVACRVDYVDIYSGEAQPPQANTASVTVVSVAVQRADTSAAIVAQRGGSANGVSNTDNINADTRYRLTPSANNSLSVGTPIELLVSAQGSGTLSGVLCVVTYTPLLHRETR